MGFIENLKLGFGDMFRGVTFKEITLFLVTMSFTLLIVILFHYSSIQKVVKQKSRCLRERSSGQTNGIFSVQAKNEFNDRLYDITYNMQNKTYDVGCACATGETINHFRDIKVYDVRNPTNPIRNVPDKVCYCDKLVEPQRTYYSGYPDLLRFMNSGDDSFFHSYSY
jgi:hypothetical protein